MCVCWFHIPSKGVYSPRLNHHDEAVKLLDEALDTALDSGSLALIDEARLATGIAKGNRGGVSGDMTKYNTIIIWYIIYNHLSPSRSESIYEQRCGEPAAGLNVAVHEATPWCA